MKLECPSQIPVLFKWDEIDTKMNAIELFRCSQDLSRSRMQNVLLFQEVSTWVFKKCLLMPAMLFMVCRTIAMDSIPEWPRGTDGTVESKMSPLDGPTTYRR